MCVCVLSTFTKKFVGLCLGPVCNPDITLQYCSQTVASVVLVTPSDGWHAPTVWHLAGLPKSKNLEYINRVGFKSCTFISLYLHVYVYMSIYVYVLRLSKCTYPHHLYHREMFWHKPSSDLSCRSTPTSLLQDWHKASRAKASRGQCM